METARIIETTYKGPTNSRGSRVVASVPSTRIVVPWDYALNPDDNHAEAARQLAAKLGWPEPTHGGNTRNGRAFFVPFG